DGVRLLRLDEEAAPVPRFGDGRATLRLSAAHSRGPPVDKAEPGKLLDALGDLRVKRTTGKRHDAVVRRAPAELLAHFVAERLAAFGVVWSHVDVHKGPRVFVAYFAAEPVDFVVAAVDGHQRRRIDCGADDLALLQVSGDEDTRFHACPGCVGRDAIGQVSSRGAGQRVELKLARDA